MQTSLKSKVNNSYQHNTQSPNIGLFPIKHFPQQHFRGRILHGALILVEKLPPPDTRPTLPNTLHAFDPTTPEIDQSDVDDFFFARGGVARGGDEDVFVFDVAVDYAEGVELVEGVG